VRQTTRLSNTKSGLGAGSYDIYVKDVSVVPATCGKKVASNVVINNLIPTGINGGSSPITTVKSAYCETHGGQLIFQKFWGKGPFRIELTRTAPSVATETYTIPRTAVPGLVTIDPATPPSVGMMTVTGYKIEDLGAGTYTAKIYDEGNGRLSAYRTCRLYLYYCVDDMGSYSIKSILNT